MPVDKVSIEKFAQTIKAKYPEYKDVEDTLLTNAIIQKYPEYKDMVDFNAKPATEAPPIKPIDFSNPANYIPGVQANQDYLKNQTDAASNRINTELLNSDKAIGSLLTKQKMNEYRQKMDQFRRNDAKGPLPTPDLTFTVSARDQKAAELKNTLHQDPVFARKVLEEQGNVFPEKKGQIQADMYQLDRGQTNPKIQENVEKLKNNKLEYNIHTKELQKPEGFWPSLATSYNDRIKSRDEYDFFQTATQQQRIDKLEADYKSYDPDEPVNAAKGIGHLGKLIGGQPPQAILAAAGVSLVPGAEEAAPWAGALVASPEIHAISYANSLKSHYKEFRDQGMTPEMAEQHAQQAADFNANVDMAQGALMTAAGTRLGLKSAKINLSEGFLGAVKKGTQEALKGAAKEAIPQGFLAAGLQGVKNLHEGKPLGEGMTEAGVQTAATIAALGLMMKAPEVLAKSPKLYKQIKQGLTKNPTVTNTEIAHMVSEGNMTPEQANQVSDVLQQHTTLDNQIPAHIEDEDTRIQIQDLIKHKEKLEHDLETLNKAYHPTIKSKIADIDEQIQKLSDLPVKEKPEGATPKPKATQGEKKLVGMPEEISPRIDLSTKTEGNETQEADQTNQAEILDQKTGAEQESAPFSNQQISQASDLLKKGIQDGKIDQEYAAFLDHSEHLLDYIQNEIKRGNESKMHAEFGNDLISLAKNESGILESRHANTVHDEKGIVSGPNDKELSTSGKRDANDLANDVADKGVKKIITSDLERAKETGEIVSKKTGATVEHKPELRTWDIGEFDGTKDTDFKRVQEYFVNHPDATEFEGKKLGESFNQYKDRVIKARTELEKEPSSTLLINHSNNMMLWDAFVKNGREWNEQAAHDYLNGEKPEPATLTTKNKDNAISIGRPEEMGTHVVRPEGAGGQSKGSGMGRSEQGQEPTGKGGAEKGQSPGEEEVNPDELPFTGRTSETVGIAHGSVQKRATESPVLPPERGEGVTVEEAVQHGRELLAKGGDAEKAAQDFKADKKISYDALSLVRAKHAELAKATNEAADKYGDNSPQAKAAGKVESDWYKDVVKPMQTEWSKIGQAQQGETDIETGTVTGLRRAYQQETGKDFTPEQAAKAKELATQVKALTDKVSKLEKQLTEAHEKAAGTEPEAKTIKEKAKKAADWIRKGKSAPPGSFSAATPASLVWDGMVEAAAKIVEAGGTIADAIDAGIKHLKDSDWYKGLSQDKQNNAIKDFVEFTEKSEKEATKNSPKSEYRQLEAERNRQLKKVSDLNDKLDKLKLWGEREKKTKGKYKEDTPEIENLKDQIYAENEKLKKIEKKQAETNHNKELSTRFANKTDNKFDAEDAKDIWEYAKKEYLDKGKNYVDTINNTSKDLGLSPEQVRNAITQPKGTRIISDEIYIQQAKRTDAINEAKRWVKTNNQPKLIKFFKAMPNFFFAAKVFGHGTVGMITHAGTNIFRPTAWKTYWPNFFRQFKYAFGGMTKAGLATYNKAMEDLKSHPDFIFWKRAGLAVDPKEKYDEYSGIGKVFGWFGAIGDRGFNTLKIYRLEMAKMFYDRLSNVEKADPETAKEIAKIVNHSTGTSEVKIPGWTTTAFFAPKLEASRWQGLITDPGKAIKTFAGWNKATPAERVQAKIVARKAGEIMATYMAGLAANSAILSLTSSKQSINYTDPLHSDWLKFKAGDKTIDATGGMEATLRFIGTLLHTGYLAYTGSKKELKDKPQDKDYKTIGQQARYKLSPFMSTVMDFATGTDAMGRPLPGSKVKPPKDVEPYTWKSYILEQQLPIPIAEGIKGTIESMKERGMDNTQIKDVLTGILIGAVSGGTGAKVGKDYNMALLTPEQKKAADQLNKWKTELNVKDKNILPTEIKYDNSTPKPTEEQTAELNNMIKAERQRLFEAVQKDLDWGKMNDAEKKAALETIMQEGADAGKEAFKTKYPQFTPTRPVMTDAEREKQQEQSEKERDIQRKIANKARELSKP